MKGIPTKVLGLGLCLLLAAPWVASARPRGPAKWLLSPHEIEIYLNLSEEQVAATQALLEDLAPLVQAGQVVYATYSEVIQIWSTQYSENPNIFMEP